MGSSITRHTAIDSIISRSAEAQNKVTESAPEIYGSYVFNTDAMKKYLVKEAFKSVMKAEKEGSKIDKKHADLIAEGMKNWAIALGATHYTHWFQPLTGLGAEKHDAFFGLDDNGKALDMFSGTALLQQEPDASSFPNGGLRTTAEARGYTIWDPTSPAFIMDVNNYKTLCIPSVYVSWKGQSLDYKTPLLRSLKAIDNSATRVCRFLNPEVSSVIATLGWEQEYFLVDEGLFQARPDLVMLGRTVFGRNSARGQQLEDHYFATIPERIHKFIADFEIEAYKIGIPVKTRHNEVAPSQFECAPHFEEVNVASDHNLLVMDLLSRIAQRHRLRVLLDEKPYAGINGSGKHNNWSLQTNLGENLLNPGKDPANNLSFLTFFVNTIKAVHDYADILRASIASEGNDYRLGANEAPPAIISVFTGHSLEEILEAMLKGETLSTEGAEEDYLNVGVERIPNIVRDKTDRNRTSPFPFTGNKFEFRAVGSSANVGFPMTVLNTMVAEQLNVFADAVDAKIAQGIATEDAVKQTLRETYAQAKVAVFNGDNYSDEWLEEAGRRGLHNARTTPLALESLISEKAQHLFEKNHVLSHEELHARYEIELEKYTKKLYIEAFMVEELALTYIVPSSIEYLNKLIEAYRGLTDMTLTSAANETKLKAQRLSDQMSQLTEKVQAMMAERSKAEAMTNLAERAVAYCDNVKPLFSKIRSHSDTLELMVDDKLWELPKYRELLFLR